MGAAFIRGRRLIANDQLLKTKAGRWQIIILQTKSRIPLPVEILADFPKRDFVPILVSSLDCKSQWER